MIEDVNADANAVANAAANAIANADRIIFLFVDSVIPDFYMGGENMI